MSFSELFFYATGVVFWLAVAFVLFMFAIGKLSIQHVQEPLCACKDRALSECPGEWEPGCDLGNNEKYVRVHKDD